MGVREGEREGGSEGGREKKKEGVKEGGREEREREGGRERGKAWYNRQLYRIPQDCVLPGTTIIMNCLERKGGRE